MMGRPKGAKNKTKRGAQGKQDRALYALVLNNPEPTTFEASMLRRWQRIKKGFIAGPTRYIQKEEAYELFDIVRKYDGCLTWVLNEILRRKSDPKLLDEIQDILTRCLKD